MDVGGIGRRLWYWWTLVVVGGNDQSERLMLSLKAADKVNLDSGLSLTVILVVLILGA